MKKYIQYIISTALTFALTASIVYAATTVPVAKNGSTEYLLYTGDTFGVGTTTPFSKLEVLTNSAPTFDDSGNALRLNYNAGGSAGTIGAGLVFAQKYLNSDNQLVRTGGIFGVKTIVNGSFGGGLAFYTQPGSAGNMTEEVRIDETGKVGIATTSPWGVLSISPLSSNTSPIVSISTTTAANATSTAFQIDSNGRVGITNSAPGFPLDVNGPVRLNGLVGIGTNPATFTLTVRNTGGFATNVTMGSSAADFRLNHTGAGTDVKEMLFRSQNGQLAISSLLDSGSFNIQNIMVIDNATGKIGLASTTAFATFAINPVAGRASNQFVVGSSTATNFIINNAGLVGIGTTTPFAFLSVAGSGGSTPLFAVASSTSSTSNIPVFEVDQTGHLFSGGTTPSLGSCGVTPAITASSTDTTGQITVGSGVVTSCVVNFANAYPTGANLHVFLNQDTGALTSSDAQSITNTGFTITSAATVGGDKISYWVISNQ